MKRHFGTMQTKKGATGIGRRSRKRERENNNSNNNKKKRFRAGGECRPTSRYCGAFGSPLYLAEAAARVRNNKESEP